MCRREVFDDFLRKRAAKLGAKVVNGLMMRMEQKDGADGPYTIHFNDYGEGGKVGPWCGAGCVRWGVGCINGAGALLGTKVLL